MRALLLALALVTSLARAGDDPMGLLTHARQEIAHAPTETQKAEKYLREALRSWDSDPGAKPVAYADASVLLALVVMGREGEDVAALTTDVLPLAQAAISIYELGPADSIRGNVALAYEIKARILQLLQRDEEVKDATDRAVAVRKQIVTDMQPAEIPSPGVIRSMHPNIKDPLVTKPTAPVVQARFDPIYSEAARLAKITGTSLVRIIVGKDGAPIRCNIVKSLGFGLDENACQAVLKWKFSPGTLDGVPVNVSANVEVSFHLL